MQRREISNIRQRFRVMAPRPRGKPRGTQRAHGIENEPQKQISFEHTAAANSSFFGRFFNQDRGGNSP